MCVMTKSLPEAYQAAPIHLKLDQRFYRPVEAAQFPEHILRYRNDRAAADVGLDGLDDAAWISHFGHFDPLPGNIQTPLALCYHGHQFGQYNPEIGDGRGFLFAQMQSADGRVLRPWHQGVGADTLFPNRRWAFDAERGGAGGSRHRNVDGLGGGHVKEFFRH